MYCRTCGKEVDSSATVCMNCGVPTGFSPLPTLTVSPNLKPNNPYAKAGFAVSLASAILGVLVFSIAGALADSAEGIGTMLIWLALLGALGGFVLSIIALVRRKHYLQGKGLAVAGLVISTVFLAGIILMFILAFVSLYGFLLFIMLLAGLR